MKSAAKPKKRTQGMNWISQHKRLAIYMRDGLACAYCGQGIESGVQLTLDHIKCYSHGGSNHESNLVTCCGHCNSSRGDRPVAEFIKGVSGYTNEPESEIRARINRLRRRSLNAHLAEAKELVARRGSCKKAIDNMKGE